MERNIVKAQRTTDNSWVYGQIVFLGDGRAVVISTDEDGTMHRTYVKPESVKRYTGIKDYNDRPIFEGDSFLLRSSDVGVCTVEWDENAGMWVGYPSDEYEAPIWPLGNVAHRIHLLGTDYVKAAVACGIELTDEALYYFAKEGTKVWWEDPEDCSSGEYFIFKSQFKFNAIDVR